MIKRTGTPSRSSRIDDLKLRDASPSQGVSLPVGRFASSFVFNRGRSNQAVRNKFIDHSVDDQPYRSLCERSRLSVPRSAVLGGTDLRDSIDRGYIIGVSLAAERAAKAIKI